MKLTAKQLSDELNATNRILFEFSKEDDRAAAILVAAEMDRLLLAILSNHLLDRNKESSPLLERDGPLEAFGSRIELAYRFGLIPPVFHNDLQMIRRIRNVFAHSQSGLSFDSPKVRTHVEKLAHGIQESQALIEKLSGEQKERFFESRNIFRLSASILLPRLVLLQFQVTRAEVKWTNFFKVQPSAE